MLREEQANMRTLQKKRDTENYLFKEKLQERAELLDKEKENKKYLEDQHGQEVHKLKKEISCLKIELDNYKANPQLNLTLELTNSHQAHRRSNLYIEKSSSNEKKGESTTTVVSHQNPECFFNCCSKSP